MTFFCDRNMGRGIPAALKLLGLPVISRDEKFAQDTPDDVWLEQAGQQGWAVLTRDMRFLRVQSQRRALRDHSVGCFVLWKAASLPRWDAVRIIARNWDEIQAAVRDESRPFLHRLYLRHPVRRVDLPAA